MPRRSVDGALAAEQKSVHRCRVIGLCAPALQHAIDRLAVDLQCARGDGAVPVTCGEHRDHMLAEDIAEGPQLCVVKNRRLSFHFRRMVQPRCQARSHVITASTRVRRDFVPRHRGKLSL